MLETIKSTAAYLKDRTEYSPQIGVILGTGLGGLVSEIEVDHTIPYEEIPDFPVSTVEGHSGELIFGKLGGKEVVAMKGRFHFYEGYHMNQVVFPVRVMKFLGVETLFVSNASGGVNPDFEIGEIMIMNDHINLFPTNPLIGPNIEALGPRFPDMSEPYSRELIARARGIASKHDIRIAEGSYAGLTGPTLETPAEYQYVRNIGADAVGMSTVPEVIAAKHMGMTCFGVSVVSDLGVPGKIVEVTHEMVQEVAAKAEPHMTTIITELIESL